MLHRRPHLYMVFPSDPSDRPQTMDAYQSVMKRYAGPVGSIRLPLDVYLMNQKEADPHFTSCQGTFMGSVSGFKDGVGHCFTGTQEQTCCRVFNAEGFRCQNMGHPVSLVELDPEFRLMDEKWNGARYPVFCFPSPARSKVLVKTNHEMGDHTFTHDHSVFFLCAHHQEIIGSFFQHHHDLSFQVDESWWNFGANSVGPAAIGMSESAIVVLSELSSTLADLATSFMNTDQNWYDPLITMMKNAFPSRQIWNRLPIQHEHVINQFNYYFGMLPPHIKSADWAISLYQFLNGIRVDQTAPIHQLTLPIGSSGSSGSSGSEKANLRLQVIQAMRPPQVIRQIRPSLREIKQAEARAKAQQLEKTRKKTDEFWKNFESKKSVEDRLIGSVAQRDNTILNFNKPIPRFTGGYMY